MKGPELISHDCNFLENAHFFIIPFVCNYGQGLGHDMGGCKTYGGRKMHQTTHPPENQNFWTPRKERLVTLVWSVFHFLERKKEQRRPRRVENVPNEGGPKPLWGGVSFVRFSSLLFQPPMASSERLFVLLLVAQIFLQLAP